MLHRGLLFPFVLALSAAASAQFTPAPADDVNVHSVAGNVSSMNGKPIANARIDLRNAATGAIFVSTYSQSNGNFEFAKVPDSSYEIVAVSGLVQTSEKIRDSADAGTIELHLPVTDSDNSSGTVSVAAMRVPDKARKELSKASDALEKHNMDDVNKHLSRALELAPTFAPALLMKAVLLIDESQFEEAKQVLQHSIESDPSFATSYVAMASLLSQDGRYDDALRTLDRAVPLAPNMWQIYFEMGKALLAKGDFARSLRNLDRAENLNSQKYGALNLLKAHALLGLKNYNLAIAELEQFLSSEPSGPDSDRARDVLQRAQAFVATGSHNAVASAQ